MNKMLLKRLLYENLETLVHIESQLEALGQENQGMLSPYIQALQDKLSQSKSKLWDYRENLDKLFSEASLESPVINEFIEDLFPALQEMIRYQANALYRLKGAQLLPQTELLIANLNLDKLLPDLPHLVILPTETDNVKQEEHVLGSALLGYLPVQNLEAPVQWFGVLETVAQFFSQQTLQINSLLEHLAIPELKEAIVSPLLSLRLLGPGYYSYYVLNAFQQSDAVALYVVEPLLFQALNRFSLVNKDLVILHQSVEKGRKYINAKEPKAMVKALQNDGLSSELLSVIERVIPDKLAFTEKYGMRAQLLEERLSQHVMVSAVPMMSSPAQLRHDLEDPDLGGAIYGVLSQLQESAASPVEVLNAGWLYKLDQSLNWLQDLINEGPEAGWEHFKRTVLDMDTLLLKSIEISEVHRVLIHEESEQLVPA